MWLVIGDFLQKACVGRVPAQKGDQGGRKTPRGGGEAGKKEEGDIFELTVVELLRKLCLQHLEMGRDMVSHQER